MPFFKFLIDVRLVVLGRATIKFFSVRTRLDVEINEVLDTCLSPVARVFLPRRGVQRHFSLEQLLDFFFPARRLAFPRQVLLLSRTLTIVDPSVSHPRAGLPRDSPLSEFISCRDKTDGRNRPI